ncbi:MAG: transporter ATP-binding protein [Clostridia bacterium]|jgi:branched-chain amino acid transport system ATP-binding protein|nr:transporter ATP-binding protein [Clostridia bacterium]MDF2892281.1 transporter ATP-binding protein [Clostridia bacterium]
MPDKVILKVKEMETYIGQYHILQGINLEVHEGYVTVLIGRNGAGKTTTLRSIIGLTPPSKGSVEFNGEMIHGLPPYAIARKGMALVPEDQGIFSQLTVEENFKIAMYKEDKQTLDRKDWILDIFPDLKPKLKLKAGSLSGGQKQMLSISRALVNNSKLLLIDEPSKGLAPIMVETLANAIKQIKDHTTVVLVEQNFWLASEVGERYYIIDDGQTVQEGVMADLIQDKVLQKRYLGIGTKE